MLCLGIETSCDETALALVADGRCVDAVLATQMDVHALFGGVVPELASREHYRFTGALYDELMRHSGCSLADVDAVAVARGPGLLGALLVGVAFAKGLALAGNKPLIAVNHLHAHLLAVGLEHELVYPALGLLVSGGHTHLYRMDAPESFVLLGRTLDDAAGEACDKFAKMLGLPYPGGVLLDKLAQRGQADPALFPRPYTHVDNLDFSFSGLKTAALQYLNAHPALVTEGQRVRTAGTDAAEGALCDVCASYMLAVADTLRLKTARALQQEPGVSSLVVAGGVAANTQVRAAMLELTASVGKPLLLPSRSLCTDNAVMIAHAGELLARKGLGHGLAFPAIPRGQKLPDDMGRLTPPLASNHS
ncbi:MAG: tRNA (adenosine(37)-N6)-threonylcarbamoyltransferase complex transferase subunit TsaD [Bilophila sp.]